MRTSSARVPLIIIIIIVMIIVIIAIIKKIMIIIIIIIIIITTNNYDNKSEEDLCTTVSIVLSANSGTFSPVFVKSLLLTSAVMRYILCSVLLLDQGPC